MVNEVLDIDGNAWCIMERGACLGDPRTKAAFGNTIKEAIVNYGDDLRASVTGGLESNLMPTVDEGFCGIKCDEPCINYIGYKHREEIVRIEMANGAKYEYPDFPVSLWREFLISENKRAFMHQKIQGRFRYQRVNGD